MIRIVTLDRFDPGDLAFLTATLYRAFGVGTEHAGERDLPAGVEGKDGRVDAMKLLSDAPLVRALPDDKVLFLTSSPLALRPGPLGEPREFAHVFARRILRSLFSRQKEQSSISGRSASPCDHDGCIAQRAS